MKNWTKRTLAAVLSLLMLLQYAPVSVFADPTETPTETVEQVQTEETEETAEETAAPEETTEETAAETTAETEAPAEEEETEGSAFAEQNAAAARAVERDAAEIVLQDGTALIPQGTSDEQVKQILFDALVVNKEGLDASAIEWEYECEGKDTKTGLAKNTAFGSIAGFESETGKVIKTRYSHPALAANEDGTYKVRVKGTTTVVNLTKIAKYSSSVAVNGSANVAMAYDANGKVEFDVLRQRIFEAVVAESNPVLTVDDVEITYYATAKTGSIGDMGKAWVPLAGAEVNRLTYPAISTGSQKIKITWNGNDSYYGFEKEVEVTLTERAESQVVLKDIGTLSTRGMTSPADILAVLVESSTVELTGENAEVQYYDKTPLIGGWKTLETLADGDYELRVVFKGNAEYQNTTSNEVTVKFVSKGNAEVVPNEEPYSVKTPYTEDAQIDIDALKTALFAAVVKQTQPELTAEDVAFTYYAAATTGTVGDLGKAWAPLEGGSVNGLSYSAISVGTWDIKITWNGNDDFYGFEKEVKVTLEERGQAPYTLQENIGTVTLAVNDDLTMDCETIRKAVFDAVVAESDVLTADNVEITYYAAAKTGSVGDLGKDWVPLAGAEVNRLTYPAVSAGEQQVRISWAGSKEYAPTTIEVTVTFADRAQAPYTKNETIGTVTLVVDDELNTDYDAIREAVFNAVIAESEVMTAENVTVEYYYQGITAVDSKWLPLEGQEIVLGQGYPAVSAGDKLVRISWAGSKEYAPTTIEVNVTFADRPTVAFNVKEGPYEVGLAFSDVENYDYDATAERIFAAVVDSTENPEGLTFADVKVEYNVDKTGITNSYKALSESDATGLVKFGAGSWKIRISWAGSKEYKGGDVIVDVTMTDNRLESVVALKEDGSFTYNMDVNVMKQAIFDSVIDWDNSTLPAKETLSMDDFVIQYKTSLMDIDTGVNLPSIPGISDSSALTQWVPIEGKVYEIAGTVLGQYPQMGAGAQQIRVKYVGNAEYRPSETTEGSVTVNKASVSVKVKTMSMYVDEALPADFVTTNPADKFDIYTISAGVTSNVTTAIYLNLPTRYQSQTFLKVLDPIAEKLYGKTFTQMMNDGVTLGELRQLLSTQELLDLLEKLNIDTGTFGQILTVINKLPSITDSIRVSFGYPNRAGMYLVTAVTDNKNYNTGVGAGVLVLKMRLSGSKLTWNESIPGGKLTAAEAAEFDFGATLSYNGDVTVNQSGVHYLYSGFTSKWKPYSSTTTPPTEPGRYVVTVCIIGGNHFAFPLTRTFQITK